MSRSNLAVENRQQNQQRQAVVAFIQICLSGQIASGVACFVFYWLYLPSGPLLLVAMMCAVGVGVCTWGLRAFRRPDFWGPSRFVLGYCFLLASVVAVLFKESGIAIGLVTYSCMILLAVFLEQPAYIYRWAVSFIGAYAVIALVRELGVFPIIPLPDLDRLLLLGLPALGLFATWTLTQLMTRNLREALTESEHARQHLEERVAERTGALAESNSSLQRVVAELAQSNSALKQVNDELARSNAELERFASVASHDLQEPLRKIQAFGDRLKTKAGPSLSDEGRDYLERMQNAASRMSNLITDLLSFARVTSKAQPFRSVDLNALLAEVLSDLEVALTSSGGTVTYPHLPTIQADPTQMRQLFQNLIGNALKFRRPGVPPEVKIASQLVPGGVQITVQDNGIGFDPKYQDKIFVLFERLHGRNEYQGTGVGLAICRKIVERHSGQISAQSVPGEGATFTFTVLTQN